MAQESAQQQFTPLISSASITAFALWIFTAVLAGMAALAVKSPLFIFLLIAVGSCFFMSTALFIQLRHRLFFALALLMAAVTFQGDNFGVSVKLDGIAVGVLALTLGLTTPSRLFQRQSYPLLLPVCGFIAANFLAAFYVSPVRSTSLAQSAILAARAITFYLVVMSVQHRPELRGKAARWFAIIMVFQTVASLAALLLYRAFPTPLVLYGQNGGSSLSLNGFFLEPNLYGIFVLCVLDIVLGMLLYSARSQVLFNSLAGLIGLAGLLLSYTRSTWLGLVLSFFVVAVALALRATRRARSIFIVLSFVFALIAMYFLISLFSLEILGFDISLTDRFREIVDSRSDSAEVRILIWSLALEDISRHPWIGNGPLSFAYVQGWLFGSVIQTVHDAGLIGLLCMLWICFGCMAYTGYAYSKALTNEDRGILLGYLVAQIALFFTSQFSSFFWGGFTWVLFGLAVGHSQIIINERRSDGRRRLIVSPMG